MIQPYFESTTLPLTIALELMIMYAIAASSRHCLYRETYQFTPLRVYNLSQNHYHPGQLKIIFWTLV